MHTAHYHFSCRFDSTAHLPEFKGSTLRGGLGQALRRIACALRQQECKQCLLRDACAYAFLFEVKPCPAPGTDGASQPKAAQRPHPYILIPPDETTRVYSAGTPFSFGLILLGTAIRYLPHVVFAVQEMGKTGIGKDNKNGEGRFHLETVRLGDRTIYDGKALTPALPSAELSLSPLPAGKKVTSITLTCLTPLRLKYDNQLQSGLPFHLLIRAALRRVSTLESTYGVNGEPALDYKGLVARAAQVGISKSSCRWVDLRRYSNRQHTAMLMGGILGTLTYEGEDLDEFIPLLRYCETVHLGKQTSFGLGRISMETGTAP